MLNMCKHDKQTRNSEEIVQLCEGSKYREGERRKWEEYSPTSLLFTEYNQIHREIMQVVETQIHKTFILCAQTPVQFYLKSETENWKLYNHRVRKLRVLRIRPIIVHKLEVVDFQQVLICFLVWKYYNFCGIKNLIKCSSVLLTIKLGRRKHFVLCSIFIFYVFGSVGSNPSSTVKN